MLYDVITLFQVAFMCAVFCLKLVNFGVDDKLLLQSGLVRSSLVQAGYSQDKSGP